MIKFRPLNGSDGKLGLVFGGCAHRDQTSSSYRSADHSGGIAVILLVRFCFLVLQLLFRTKSKVLIGANP